MIHYIANFIVYTLAMIGVLVLGFVVYKKTIIQTPARKNSMLKIADMLRLPDRKTLYVIECRNQQFLIASSNDKVSLISKLDRKSEDIEKYLKEKNEKTPDNALIEKYIAQNSSIREHFEETGQEASVQNQIIKSLLKELSDKNQTKRSNY